MQRVYTAYCHHNGHPLLTFEPFARAASTPAFRTPSVTDRQLRIRHTDIHMPIKCSVPARPHNGHAARPAYMILVPTDAFGRRWQTYGPRQSLIAGIWSRHAVAYFLTNEASGPWTPTIILRDGSHDEQAPDTRSVNIVTRTLTVLKQPSKEILRPIKTRHRWQRNRYTFKTAPLHELSGSVRLNRFQILTLLQRCDVNHLLSAAACLWYVKPQNRVKITCEFAHELRGPKRRNAHLQLVINGRKSLRRDRLCCRVLSDAEVYSNHNSIYGVPTLFYSHVFYSK